MQSQPGVQQTAATGLARGKPGMYESSKIARFALLNPCSTGKLNIKQDLLLKHRYFIHGRQEGCRISMEASSHLREKTRTLSPE